MSWYVDYLKNAKEEINKIPCPGISEQRSRDEALRYIDAVIRSVESRT